MTKRVAAALLWFLAGWCAWGLIAALTSVSPLFGPVLGAAIAALVAGDPMHKIWGPRVSTERINSRLESISQHA
jgi:hypothetical protein